LVSKANDSIASLRRYQRMKYVPDNALQGCKKSQVSPILHRHVERVQRNSFPMWQMGSEPAQQSRYNRYRVTGRRRESRRAAFFADGELRFTRLLF
jgi:hypothetical protein